MESSVRKPVARRVEWIDTLRGMAVVLVALFHAWILLPPDSRPVGMNWLNSVLGNYRMPALMFTSGILLDLSLRKPVGIYIVGKLRAIVWPWLLWTAVMVPLLGMSHYRELLWWLNGTHTWYLMALTMCFAIAIVLRKIPHWIVALVLLGLSLTLGPAGARWLWNAGFFFAGAAMGDRWQRVAEAPRWVVGVALTGTIIWSGWRLHLDAPGERTLLTTVMVLLGILLIIWVLVRTRPNWITRAFDWIGKDSIVTYLVHWPAALVIYRLTGGPVGWPGFLIVSVGSLAVCVLMTWARPWTKWLYRFPLPRKKKTAAVS